MSYKAHRRVFNALVEIVVARGFCHGHLTVKLRGRTPAPDGAEGAQFLSARGANPRALHGPLERLLGISIIRNGHLQAANNPRCDVVYPAP